jgi:Zn-dependent protease
VPGRSIRIARIAGIPVGISPWWLLIVVLLTWSLADGYFAERDPALSAAAALALALAAVLLVFAGILAHEFAHAVVARRAGVEIEEIDLWLLGGVARMRSRPRRPMDELRFALAGPAVTALLAVLFLLLALALEPAAPPALQAFVDYQLRINAAIAAFNLLPALPLDGGRVARALLWRHTGDLRRATVLAAAGGRAVGYGLVALSPLALLAGASGAFWLALVGLFLVVAATGEQRQVELAEALGAVTVGALMEEPLLLTAVPRPSELRAVLRTASRAPVMVGADGAVIGLLSARRALRGEGGASAIVAAPLVGPGERASALLDRPDFASVGAAVVVDDARRPVGVVAIADLERYVRPQDTRGTGPRVAGVTR